MKSHLDSVLAVYEGIVNDTTARWPNHRSSLELDLSYLRRASKQRGIPFFTVTLPSFGKVIDMSLDEGYLLASEVPQGIPTIKGRPELFRGLLEEVFGQDGTLRVDSDPGALAHLRQLCYAAKKLRLDCSDAAKQETLDEFFRVEASLPRPHPQTWFADEPVWESRSGHPLWGDRRSSGETEQDLFPDTCLAPDPIPWDALRALARRVVSEMGTPDWFSLEPKHGPGAVSERLDGGVKFDFPHWPRKLGQWFPYDWYGTGNLTEPESYPSDREPPSRLIAVPKDQRGPRLICAEPVAHQYMQQAIAGWLTERIDRGVLSRTITLRSQENSRERALRSSRTAEYTTIDLSSASDRLSCRLVEYIFQGSEILDGFHSARTRLLSQDLTKRHPRVVALNKFSTQGSALTFPVQSIVFAILTCFALRWQEGRENDWEGWRSDFARITVFGDDIIAPNAAYSAIEAVLHSCGLKVNPKKSFHRDPLRWRDSQFPVLVGRPGQLPDEALFAPTRCFRESCGMDAYGGVDVTPAYFLEAYDGTPESMAATIESSNNFYRRGYWKTAEIVAAQIPESERKLIPVLGPDSGGLGLFSFCGERLTSRKRWNRDLHREEYLELTTTSKVEKTKGSGQASLTQYFVEKPNPDIVWESGQAGHVRVRKTRSWVSR